MALQHPSAGEAERRRALAILAANPVGPVIPYLAFAAIATVAFQVWGEGFASLLCSKLNMPLILSMALGLAEPGFAGWLLSFGFSLLPWAAGQSARALNRRSKGAGDNHGVNR